MQDVTAIVKTFRRPQSLLRLLETLRVQYPEMPVLIADDSQPAYSEVSAPFPGVEHYVLPDDEGGAYGRNFLLERVATPYALYVDDDFIFTEETQVERLLTFVKNGIWDLAAGAVCNGRQPIEYDATFELQGDVLWLRPQVSVNAPHRTDITVNFFASSTEHLQEIRWDSSLRQGYHLDFFYRCWLAGVKVGTLPSVKAGHDRGGDHEYNKLRRREMDLNHHRFLVKHGLREVRGRMRWTRMEGASCAA